MKEHEVESYNACPVCGAEYETYRDLEFDEQLIYLRFTCAQCGQESVEIYQYSNTWYESEE